MASEIVDLFVEQGADYSLQLALSDALGVAWDWDLYTARGSVKIDMSTFTMSFTEGDDGVITLEIPASTTQTIPHGVGLYDVEIVEDATGFVQRIMKGRVYIDQEVTI
jgi:hypothetical protein